jgi:nickel transport protein
LFIFAGPCFAHKIRIFAWSEGNTIHTESKFSGGKAAQNAIVTVVETNTGTELLRGTTNQNGLFQFPLPETTSEELDIIVNSGDGHKNHWLYAIKPVTSSNTTKAEQNHTPPEELSPLPQSLHLSQDQLTSLMDSLLESKLAPIRQQLAELQEQEPSIQDILGGIGYIIGLAGIAAYMKSKPGKK